MKIKTSKTLYIDTEDLSDYDLTKAICAYSALAATDIWVALMREQRRRNEAKAR